MDPRKTIDESGAGLWRCELIHSTRGRMVDFAEACHVSAKASDP